MLECNRKCNCIFSQRNVFFTLQMNEIEFAIHSREMRWSLRSELLLNCAKDACTVAVCWNSAAEKVHSFFFQFHSTLWRSLMKYSPLEIAFTAIRNEKIATFMKFHHFFSLRFLLRDRREGVSEVIGVHNVQFSGRRHHHSAHIESFPDSFHSLPLPKPARLYIHSKRSWIAEEKTFFGAIAVAMGMHFVVAFHFLLPRIQYISVERDGSQGEFGGRPAQERASQTQTRFSQQWTRKNFSPWLFFFPLKFYQLNFRKFRLTESWTSWGEWGKSWRLLTFKMYPVWHQSIQLMHEVESFTVEIWVKISF